MTKLPTLDLEPSNSFARAPSTSAQANSCGKKCNPTFENAMSDMTSKLALKLANDEAAKLVAKQNLAKLIKTLNHERRALSSLTMRINTLSKRIDQAKISGNEGFVEAANQSLALLRRQQSELETNLDAQELEADRLQVHIDHTECSCFKLRLMLTELDSEGLVDSSKSDEQLHTPAQSLN